MSWSSGPSDPSGTYQQPQQRNGFFEAMRNSGWYRAQPRVIGGVCSGIAARTGWDLSLVRVLTVLAAFFAPVVFIVYALAWLFLPEASDGRIHTEETFNGNFDVAFLGGVVLAVIGLSSVIPSVGVFGTVAIGWGVFTTLIIVGVCIAAIASSNTRNTSGAHMSDPRGPQYGNPAAHAPQHGNPATNAPQHGNPAAHAHQYGAPGANHAAGASAPVGPGSPDNLRAGAPAPGTVHGATGFSSHAPQGGAPSAGQRGGQGPAAPRPPHVGWVPPTPAPHAWSPPPTPTHRPRTVPGRVSLAITGLIILVFAAAFAAMYATGQGYTIPGVSAASEATTYSHIVLIGGGACLLIVGLSLAVAALRDRSAAWLLALSIIGMLFALPTAALGTEDAQGRLQQAGPALTNPTGSTTLDWKADSVQGGSPTGSTTLDLTGAPVGTAKTITVGWRAWSNLTILFTEGQPIQIICQSGIDSVSTNMPGDGWVAPMRRCSDETKVASPSWGNSDLGGITIVIDDSASLETLQVTQVPDASHTWGSGTATPSPSSTPSTSPAPTPSDAQSGN